MSDKTALEIAKEWLAYEGRFSVVAEVVNGAITDGDLLVVANEVVRRDQAIDAIAQHLGCYPGRAAIIEAIDEIKAARNARADECAQLGSAMRDANARQDNLEAKLVALENNQAKLEAALAEVERVREMFCDGTNCQTIAGELIHSTDCIVAIRLATRS